MISSDKSTRKEESIKFTDLSGHFFYFLTPSPPRSFSLNASTCQFSIVYPSGVRPGNHEEFFLVGKLPLQRLRWLGHGWPLAGIFRGALLLLTQGGDHLTVLTFTGYCVRNRLRGGACLP